VDYVRDAAHGASKVVMGKLTSTGVKLMMPSLLKGLLEPQWRAKQASILLLGSMAYVLGCGRSGGHRVGSGVGCLGASCGEG
jgi:hypothetical protein